MKKTFKDWIIATRPWSFPASSVPIIAMGSYLFYLHGTAGTPFSLVTVALALLMMMLFQAAGNLISDAADHEHTVDLPGSLNGVRHIQSGLFTAQGSRQYGLTLLSVAVVNGIAILLNIYSMHFAQQSMALTILCAIGLAGVALSIWYPQIKYHALGDVDILLCYSLLPSFGLGIAILGEPYYPLLFLCLPFGLQTVAILHANNTRDIRNDRRAGITTLSHLLGGKTSQQLYVIEILTPYVLIVLYAILGIVPYWCLLSLLMLPIAIKNSKWMLSVPEEDEQGIATLDQATAQMQLFTGLLYSAGFILGTFF